MDVVVAGAALARPMNNYFEYFDLPVDYNIDVSNLLRVYLAYQMDVHPDCGGTSDESALLNIAYKTLSDPLKRAQHFLDLKGIDTERLSPNMAMKMFEIRERYNSLTNEEERHQFCNDLDQCKQQLIEQLKSISVEEFAEIFSEVKFINSFLEKVRSDCDRY